MAKKIGVRELKNNASKIVRAVREERAEYVVTVHGEPVAVLRPFAEAEDEADREAEVARFMAELEALSREVSAKWNSEKSALEALEEARQGSFERLL